METLVVRKANEDAQRAREEHDAKVEQDRLDALADASDDDTSHPASGDHHDSEYDTEDDDHSVADAALREAADLTRESLEATARPVSPP
jgi:hypothetical protein